MRSSSTPYSTPLRKAIIQASRHLALPEKMGVFGCLALELGAAESHGPNWFCQG